MPARIPLPLFACLLPGVGHALLLQSGPDRFLPLFTSIEYAELYRSRTGTPYVLQKLSTKDQVRQFVTEPPFPAGATFTEYDIMIDPVDKNTRDYSTFDRVTFIESVSGK